MILTLNLKKKFPSLKIIAVSLHLNGVTRFGRDSCHQALLRDLIAKSLAEV